MRLGGFSLLPTSPRSAKHPFPFPFILFPPLLLLTLLVSSPAFHFTSLFSPQNPRTYPNRNPAHKNKSQLKQGKTYFLFLTHPPYQLLKFLIQPALLCKKRRSLRRHVADMNNVTGILAVFLQDRVDYGAGRRKGGYGEGAGGVFVLLLRAVLVMEDGM